MNQEKAKACFIKSGFRDTGERETEDVLTVGIFEKIVSSVSPVG
jgi:hypothetical protein